MAERRFKELTPETMTPEQKKVADAIQSGPRGAGLRGPFNALLRSPDLCDLVQRVGAYVRYSSSIPSQLNEMAIIMAGRKWTAQYEFYAHRKLAIEAGLKPGDLRRDRAWHSGLRACRTMKPGSITSARSCWRQVVYRTRPTRQ